MICSRNTINGSFDCLRTRQCSHMLWRVSSAASPMASTYMQLEVLCTLFCLLCKVMPMVHHLANTHCSALFWQLSRAYALLWPWVASLLTSKRRLLTRTEWFLLGILHTPGAPRSLLDAYFHFSALNCGRIMGDTGCMKTNKWNPQIDVFMDYHCIYVFYPLTKSWQAVDVRL